MPSAEQQPLECKTRRWYKTQRMGTDFCPAPTPVQIADHEITTLERKNGLTSV